MASIWIVLVLTLVGQSYCQTFVNVPLVVNLYEEEETQTDLATLSCTHTVDIKVQLLGISPVGICDPCFAIYKIAPSPDFKLYFLPSQGSVKYNPVRIFSFLIGCTADDVTVINQTLEVRLRTNEPPTFTALGDTFTGFDAKTTTKDTVLYTVSDASDPDGDPLFYNLTVQPASSSSKYSIGYTDGIIRASADLSSECQPTVLFIVTVHDKRHAPVGPKYITLTFTDYYTVPYISTLNSAITLSESIAVLDTVGPADITAQSNVASINYIITTLPEVLNFVIPVAVPPRIILDKKLSWESGFNDIRIAVTPDNGFCIPETFYLDIDIIDANDPPVMLPTTDTVWLYEHEIDLNNRFTVTDEDQFDSYSFSIVPGLDSGHFAIDYFTGKITAVGYDVDGLTGDPTQVTLTIQVEDTKGPDIGNATLTINILDSNDNPPVFGALRFDVTAEECATSQNLGTVPVSDTVDSAFNDNNLVSCVQNDNGNIFVLSDCSFWLSTPLPVGSISSLVVSAVDHGLVPGPQASKQNATVVMTFTACTLTTPSTIAPTTQPPTTVPPTTTTPTPTVPGLDGLIPGTSTNGGDAASNIAWIIVACVMGCVALAAAAFFITRFCLPNCNEGNSSRFRQGSGGKNRTNPQQNQQNQQNQNQHRSNTQKNVQKPVSAREVKPYEPKDGAEAYRISDGVNNTQQKNVWHGMGTQPGKGFDL